MAPPDLNLLVALDALLSEGSVTAAATRLKLSPSAMSRTLSRLRDATGDPLLVRAGRGLVPTPRALELRGRTGALLEEATAVLRPAAKPRLDQLERTFTIRSSDGFVENFGARLVARLAREAPAVRLRFQQKSDRESSPLREGQIDLDTGVVDGTIAPELKVQTLFRDHLVGVVRKGHPLTRGRVTMPRFIDAAHVAVRRRDAGRGLIEEVLAKQGLERRVMAVVGGFAAALTLARGTDLVAVVPANHTLSLRAGLEEFTLPFAMDELIVAMMWHPRFDADPAHRWLRDTVREVCRATLSAKG